MKTWLKGFFYSLGLLVFGMLLASLLDYTFAKHPVISLICFILFICSLFGYLYWKINND